MNFRTLLICSLWCLSFYSFAEEQSIFIEHQITQEIIVESEQTDNQILQIIWQNINNAIQHISELHANIHKKNELLDISAKVQSFLQFPEFDTVGSLPAWWVESVIEQDGSGYLVFEMPSHWYESPETASIVDWNGLNGELDFHPKLTTWEMTANINGLILKDFNGINLQLAPGAISADYGLHLSQKVKPILKTTLHLPTLSYSKDAAQLSIHYLQLANTLRPELHLPIGLNVTLEKLCYQNPQSNSAKSYLFNVFSLIADMKAFDTDSQFIKLPAKMTLFNLWDKKDILPFINWLALRPSEINIEFEQLSLHETGFIGENTCKPSKQATSLKDYTDDFLHIEAQNFIFNTRTEQQQSGLELKKAFLHLGATAFKIAGFSSQLDNLKMTLLSDFANDKNQVELKLNTDVNALRLRPIFTDGEQLNISSLLTIKNLDANTLLALQNFSKQLIQDSAIQDEPSTFWFALLGKFMELTPALLKQSPEIQLTGLQDKKAQFSLDENNQLSGTITLGIDGNQITQLLDIKTIIAALHGKIDLTIHLTQNKINSFFNDLLTTEQQTIFNQWADEFKQDETYILKLDMSLKNAQLLGHNDISELIAIILQPLIGEFP